MLQPNIITTLTEMPDLYQPGAPLWTEHHIAEEMLKAHLYPETDAASYRPETIEAICTTLPERMKLPRGAAPARSRVRAGAILQKPRRARVCRDGR
jgi:hypothetical protein